MMSLEKPFTPLRGYTFILIFYIFSMKVPLAEAPVNQDKVKGLNKEQVEQRQHTLHGHGELLRSQEVQCRSRTWAFIFVWSDHLLEPHACCYYSLSGQKRPISVGIISHLSTYSESKLAGAYGNITASFHFFYIYVNGWQAAL